MRIEEFFDPLTYKDFYGNHLITYDIKDLVDMEESVDLKFLSKIGIPKDMLGNFEVLSQLKNTDNHLIFGKMSYVKDRFLAIEKRNSSVVLFQSDVNREFLFNASFTQFIACIYEFDFFLKNCVEPETFGEFYSNRKKYAESIRKKLLLIDAEISRSLWEDELDEMESGAW